jgi:hypothetical protein
MIQWCYHWLQRLHGTQQAKEFQMAKRTHVLLIDDLDGGTADETVAFGLDGSIYEIDLSAENAGQLRDALAAYVAHGRKASTVRGVSRRRGASAHAGGSVKTAEIRHWARSNGYSVNDRGRIASDVMEAFQAAH